MTYVGALFPSPVPMQRRTFFQLVATTGVLLPFGACLPEPTAPAPLAQPLSLSAILDDDGLRHLGEQYRAHHPDEATTDRLAEHMLRDAVGQPPTKDDPEQLATFLLQKIHRDYEAEHTVMLGGWVLSVTEARQCALFSLIA